MITAVFHGLAFAALIAGLLLSIGLMAALTLVVAGGTGRERQRQRPNRRRSERVLRGAVRFELATDR